MQLVWFALGQAGKLQQGLHIVTTRLTHFAARASVTTYLIGSERQKQEKRRRASTQRAAAVVRNATYDPRDWPAVLDPIDTCTVIETYA